MESEADTPTDLEMELRRNLTPCRCSHTFMQHDDTFTTHCLVCTCMSYKEFLASA